MKSIETEDNEMLLRRFVSEVGYDYKKDYEPRTYPDFSENTVKIWKEIEKRMKAPITLDFDAEKCKSQIKDELDNQESILKNWPDYSTSYHVGIVSGLNIALGIVSGCIQRRE